MLKVYVISKKQVGKYIEKATEDHYWHTNPQHRSLNSKLWELGKVLCRTVSNTLGLFSPSSPGIWYQPCFAERDEKGGASIPATPGQSTDGMEQALNYNNP